MRLDQFISQAAGVPRSQAQRLIRTAQVQVDGVVVKQSRQQVLPEQSIQLEKQVLTLPQPLYLMLNKPADVVSATQDASQPTVLALIDHPWRHTLHIVGRLDKDTTGLLLLTSEGDWSHRITSPRHKVGKTYLVSLAEPITTTAIAQLRQGVLLRGEAQYTAPAEVEQLTPHQLRLCIYEGKYHQVKRMLAAVGNHVVALHREKIGSLTLDANLALGEWRELTLAERLTIE